jgi:hypothetical protein
MKDDIENGLEAEIWSGRKIRNASFFCPEHLSAISPLGLEL